MVFSCLVLTGLYSEHCLIMCRVSVILCTLNILAKLVSRHTRACVRLRACRVRAPDGAARDIPSHRRYPWFFFGKKKPLRQS